MDDGKAYLGARERLSRLDTPELARAWVRDQRVDWAERALYDELVERGVDPASLTKEGAHATPVYTPPAWVQTPVPTSESPSRPRREMPLAWFIGVFVVMLGWSAVITWFALLSHDTGATTRRIMLTVLSVVIGGGLVQRVTSIGFRYVFCSTWAAGLLIATMTFAALPHGSPRSVFEDDAGANLLVLNQQQAEQAASVAMTEWRRTYERVHEDMKRHHHLGFLAPSLLKDPATRQQAKEALRGWRGDVLELRSADAHVRSTLEAKDAMLSFDRSRHSPMISQWMAEVEQTRSSSDPVRDDGLALDNAIENLAIFLDAHPAADEPGRVEYDALVKKVYAASRQVEDTVAALKASSEPTRH